MKPILTVVLLLPLCVFAQRIKRNEIDRFTKQPIVVTDAEVLRQGTANGLSVSLKSEGPKFFVLLSGYGAESVTIGAGDQTVFLLSNDSTVTVTANSMQSFELNKSNKPVYNHLYPINTAQVEMFARANVRSIRKYHLKGYTDIDIHERHRDKLRRLSSLFLETVASNKQQFAVPMIALAEVEKFVGDSVRVCGKIFGGRYLSANENKPTLLNMGASYPNQPLTIVIWGVDRAAFGKEPEESYKDKEVCAEGRISLYRSKPQMVVKDPAQLQLREQTASAEKQF